MNGGFVNSTGFNNLFEVGCSDFLTAKREDRTRLYFALRWLGSIYLLTVCFSTKLSFCDISLPLALNWWNGS